MKTKITLFAIIAATLTLVSCGNNSSKNNTQTGKTKTTTVKSLIGAGATFPYPLYSKMFYNYHQKTGIKVNYQSVGSGAGIQQIQNKIVDFGASDAPMSDKEMKQSPGYIVHIPTCLGAVVITYNLPGKPTLKFTPEVLADIFLGKITKWNDSKIASINPNVKLPSLPISVIHRSDGSGTTYIFSDYLTKISSDWESKVGKGKSLKWPIGLGAKGNEGVSGFVKQTPGSIGYVELAYAFQNKMPKASLQNASGNFIAPTLASISAAADIDNMPKDLRVSITNTSAPEGYPISSFSYILVYQNQSYDNRTQAKAQATINLIDWMIHEGQEFNESLKYGKLPEKVVKKATNRLETVTYNSKSLLK